MGNRALITSREIMYLPVDRIRPNPYQPRKIFERAKLDELARSIKEYGVMQPISVRLINGLCYELVAGERRLRATKIAGLTNIPAIVVNINDQHSAMLAMIENLQRQDLNYFEEAEGYQNLLSDYGFTQEELAERMGKSQSAIANKLRILKLPKGVQAFLLENELTERHARALLSLGTEEEQMQMLQQVVSEHMTVKATEECIEKYSQRKTLKKPGTIQNIKGYIRDIRLFTNTIKQAVDMMQKAGVDTNYLVTEKEDGCDIHIHVTW